MIEVELKFALSSGARAEIEPRLAVMPRTRHLHNLDIYYDTATFALLRQAVFVRVRNQQRLEFKFNEQAAPAHVYCAERAFSLEPQASEATEMNALFSNFLPGWRAADTVGAALHQNGLIELARIENHRAQYNAGDLVVCLDRVEGLGEFLEIEKQCEEGAQLHRAIAHVERVASGLAGASARRVHIGYVELWLERHHPRAYYLGKYQEERPSA